MISSLLLPQSSAASCSFFSGRTLITQDGSCPCRVSVPAIRKNRSLQLTVQSNWQDEAEDRSSKNIKPGSTDGSQTGAMQKMITTAATLLAAGALLLLPAGDAMAAKTGGRIGGSAFRSAPPSSRAAPRAAPRAPPQVNRSRTNVYINPPVAAPPIFGYGPAPIFGGWSPFYSYGPSVAIGGGGSFFSLFFFFLISSVVFNVIRGFFRGRDDDY